MLSTFWILLIIFTLRCIAEESEVTKYMRHLDIIPDLLDEGPQGFLNVTYKGDIVVGKGYELTPIQVRDEPIVIWPSSTGSYYTLIMVDIDAYKREAITHKELLLWLIVNIPDDRLGLGEVRAEYMGALPELGTGTHRYIFLLYKQQEVININMPMLPKHSALGRSTFKTREFIGHYKMGPPVAGNFFTAKWSTDVPNLSKSIVNS